MKIVSDNFSTFIINKTSDEADNRLRNKFKDIHAHHENEVEKEAKKDALKDEAITFISAHDEMKIALCSDTVWFNVCLSKMPAKTFHKGT